MNRTIIKKSLRQLILTAQTIEVELGSKNISDEKIYRDLEDLDYFHKKLKLSVDRNI